MHQASYCSLVQKAFDVVFIHQPLSSEVLNCDKLRPMPVLVVRQTVVTSAATTTTAAAAAAACSVDETVYAP